MVANFPDHEYERRLAKLAELAHARDLALVFVFGFHNWYRDHTIRYLTGYGSPHAPSLLVLAAEEPRRLHIGDRDDFDRAREASFVKDVTVSNDLAEVVEREIKARSVRRVGIAGGEGLGFTAIEALPRDVTAVLQSENVEPIDLARHLQMFRMVRSDLELATLRESARIADIGAAAFLATVRAGVSERDVWSEVWYAMQQAGAQDVHVSMTCGPRSFWPHPPSDATFQPQDVVSIELSPRLNGYFSQSNRMCFVGEPSREWRELDRLAHGAREIALKSMHAGTPVSQVVKNVTGFVAESPLATMDVGGVHRIGHGVGTSLDEDPFLTSSSSALLMANSTMAMHPIIYLPYRHSLLMLGDYVRIRQHGEPEVLTTPQTSIPVV